MECKELVYKNNIQENKILFLSKRQLCDLECLLQDVFYPLTGFLDRDNYESVCNDMRLTNGLLWPIPITLDVSDAIARSLQVGEKVLLVNDENTPLALLTLTSIWKPNKKHEALSIYGTLDTKHPGVNYLFNESEDYYLGGSIIELNKIVHYDFTDYRHTPLNLKNWFKINNWSKIIAFQTRNPIHRAHYELTLRSSELIDANLLIHPVVGMSKSGDIDYITRVKCYEFVLQYYPTKKVKLSLLPLAMRMAGPREGIWHALIRKNYGATHFIMGRDHAGPGLNSHGVSFYDPMAAQKAVLSYQSEIEIEIIPFSAIVYAKNRKSFISIEEVNNNDEIEEISGTELRHNLINRLDIPEWFSFPEVLDILRKSYPKPLTQGYTVFFTGLSGAGKSTLAKALIAKIQEKNLRSVTLLDGDLIRQHLSRELGFSKKDRCINVERVGFVASEIVKHNGIAICAMIAPYAESRLAIRKMIQYFGGFIEVYVSTSVDVCKNRDIKGLYKKAELGLISSFTGVNDPYEEPINPDLILDTDKLDIISSLSLIIDKIESLGYSL